MALEIERKFLVASEAWRELRRKGAEGTLYRQGYLSSAAARTVRIRIVGQRACLTVKGPTRGTTRAEYEYEIPLADAEAMLDALAERPLIEKWRYRISFAGHLWEVDEFLGANAGLIVAEIELERADETFVRPPWVGVEVGHDPRYFNANLVAHPYAEWEES